MLLVLVVAATACRSQDNTVPEVTNEERIIATASSTDDPSVLRITWFPAPCERFVGVDVELDEQYANLTVNTLVDFANCIDPNDVVSGTTVDLGEPLGDREIWDRAFKDTVALDAN